MIADISQTLFEITRMAAEDYAERNQKRIWNLIVKRIDEEKDKGLNSVFKIIDSSRKRLLWYPFIKEGDSSDVKKLKSRLAYRGKILDHLDSDDNISFRDYEALGCVVSILAGALRWHLTPQGNELGIDFISVLPAFGKGHLFPNSQKKIKIVGQSKKWTSKVPWDKIDSLANRLDDIRRRSQRVLEKLPPWFLSEKGTLVGLMLAHSGVQAGGHDFANDHGIIIADSRDLAEILVLSKHWNVAEKTTGPIDLLQGNIQRVYLEES